MASLSELRRQKNNLELARKLLTGTLLLELPFLIEIALRQSDLLLHTDILGTRQMPGSLAGFLWVASAVSAIVGFTIACRVLSLWEGDLENTEFAQRTRLLGSRKIAASIQLVFYLMFLIPLFNLMPAMWARSQASGAIRDLDGLLPARRGSSRTT